MNSTEIYERRNKIVEMIKENGRLYTENAAKHFGVSIETIRQDLLYLESRQIVKKIYGGAVLSEANTVEPITKRQSENYSKKIAIARKALSYLPQDGGVIGMDMGSTVALLAEQMINTTNALVITNSHLVMQKMIASNNRLYALGGEYNALDMAYQGEQTQSALSSLSLDVTFMGTSGVLGRGGICSMDFHDIAIKQEYIKHSAKTIILTDSSKFFSGSLIEVAPWSSIDMLITDEGIPADVAASLKEQLELVIV